MDLGHARRIVWRRLDEARAVKARVDAGTAFDWEKRRLGSLVSEARLYSRKARDLRRASLPSPASGISYTTVSNHRNNSQ